MKINLNDLRQNDLRQNKTIHPTTIVARAIFHENNNYYAQMVLDECLYKL